MYIVTGISRGLGKAVVEELLQRKEKVIGIGRSHSFQDENFTFLKCDLSSLHELDDLTFPCFNEPVVLINNAGILGQVKRIMDQKESDLQEVLQINVVAPILLARKVYHSIKNKGDFSLINISSGAGRRAIPSWAAYCASKAALNMLTETFYLEEKEKGNVLKVYAVSPGVIDTEMQVKIRTSDDSDFSSVENFRKMKAENELFSPKEAAKRLLKLIESPYNQEVLADLRTI